MSKQINETIEKAHHTAQLLTSDLIEAMWQASPILALILYEQAKSAAALRDAIGRLVVAMKTEDRPPNRPSPIRCFAPRIDGVTPCKRF